jgi:cytochrome c oxidase subunit IV
MKNEMRPAESSPESSILQLSFVFVALMVLLGLTYWLAHVDLGPFNTAVGLIVAAAKALLVALFFMELKSSSGVHRIAAMVGLFWVGILMSLTLADYLSRNWLPLPSMWPP